MDVKWLLAAAGVACACTVPDPSYVSPLDESSDASTAAEGDSESTAGDESGAATGAEGDTGDGDGSQDESASTGDGDSGDADSGDGDSGDGDSSEGDSGEGDSGEGDSGATPFEHTSRDCADADPAVGMSEVQAVLNLHCIECHSPPSTPQGLDLTAGSAWGSLVNEWAGNCSKIRVIPGDPAASYLLDKLEDIDLCSGQPMPKNREPLSIEDRNEIQSWICAGAPQD